MRQSEIGEVTHRSPGADSRGKPQSLVRDGPLKVEDVETAAKHFNKAGAFSAPRRRDEIDLAALRNITAKWERRAPSCLKAMNAGGCVGRPAFAARASDVAARCCNPHAGLDDVLGIGDAEKPVLVQALIAKLATIEAFDIGVLDRFARTNEAQFDPVSIGPCT